MMWCDMICIWTWVLIKDPNFFLIECRVYTNKCRQKAKMQKNTNKNEALPMAMNLIFVYVESNEQFKWRRRRRRYYSPTAKMCSCEINFVYMLNVKQIQLISCCADEHYNQQPQPQPSLILHVYRKWNTKITKNNLPLVFFSAIHKIISHHKINVEI